jgi:transcription elongation factor Elf1
MSNYKDNPEYHKKRVAERRRLIKQKAIDYKGGKCEICGYNKCSRALSFHHRNPAEKDFNISLRGHSRSWDRVKAELDKCVLLCANCHMEVENGITTVSMDV